MPIPEPARAHQTVERIGRSTQEHPVLGDISAWRVGNRVGESPVWHRGQGALYWIDVRAQQLLRLQPEAPELLRWALPDVVGAVALRGPRACWMALRHAIVEMDLETGRLEQVCAVEDGRHGNRLNEGKASPSGRWFVFGSMDDRPDKQANGSLYRAGSNGHVEPLYEGLAVANGIAWSLDARQIYFSDSWRGHLLRANWDEASGSMGKPVRIAAFTDEQGRPDGACTDAEGHYWSAGVSAGVLNRLDADGALLESLALPCRAPTMCAFGGGDAQTMFVTSLVRPQWTESGAWDGALLAFRTPTPGKLQADLTF